MMTQKKFSGAQLPLVEVVVVISSIIVANSKNNSNSRY